MTRRTAVFAGTVAVTLGGFAVLGFACATRGGPDARAHTACVRAIEAQLHDPGSAVFGDTYVRRLPDSSREFTIRLRAKNGFGAYRSNDVTCVVSTAMRVTSVSMSPR